MSVLPGVAEASANIVVRQSVSLSFPQLFGAGFVGVLIAMGVYGIACAQVHYYYTEYTEDARWLKGIVAVMWALHTVQIVFSCHAAYYYLVSSAFDLSKLVHYQWSISAALAIHGAIATVFFPYFMSLVFQLGPPKWRYGLVGFLGIFVLAVIASSYLSVAGLSSTEWLLDIPPLINRFLVPPAATHLAADLVFCVTLCVLLHTHRTAFKRTDALINTLIVFAVSRGLLTAVVALIALLLLLLKRNSFWYISTVAVLGGLYVNSLLATLNARNSLRSKNQGGVTSHFATPLAYPEGKGPTGGPAANVHLGTSRRREVVSIDFHARSTEPQSSTGSDIIVIGPDGEKRKDSV